MPFSSFRPLALHLHGNQRNYSYYSSKKGWIEPKQFQGVHINDIPTLEDLLTLNILLYDVDIVDGNIIAEFARRSVQNY